ncbi:hypothetical protein BDM02DRAFT_2507478 [Thelephora ganbajun]|uniref:Uncharacterized protein n=1 Tax=Thelephora ganbajun TaxID=370292 RepID=A0ACB6ZDW9_THEGA|nr:hypothetical protein BDM02DRAFT_2507478 [Thelephora ganbajun]
MTQYYPSPQPTQGDASTRNGPYPTDRSSPFYPMPPQVDITSQAANHLQQGVQYSSDRRSSLQPLYSPTPRQSINFFPLPSPPRSNSSYSRSETSSVQPGQSMSRRTSFQWPVPHDQSNRSVSNPSSVTHPHNDADSQSPSYPHLVNSFGNSGQALDPTLYAWPPSYLGEVPPQHTLPYPPNDGPPFPASQSSQPAPAKRKRVTRSNPYPRSGQQTEKQVSPPDDPPVASSSRVRLDMLPPAPAHGEGSNFKATAKERDAKRKRGDRASKGCWKERLADLLPASQPRPKKLLEILDAVIKYFGGDPLEVVDQPCEPEKKYDSPKSRLNSIRRNNERRGYERIREILQAWGYHVTSATSRINILQIVVYMLEMENGTVSEDLIKLIDKFSGQDPGAPGP